MQYRYIFPGADCTGEVLTELSDKIFKLFSQ